MYGTKREKLRLEVSSDKNNEAKGPKRGKEDPDNAPHHGGNTWAGGTGGSDTAGLGGKGGPYRLDKGHDVHQVSDEAKRDVPDHIKKAARELAQKEFQRRLEEIKMTPNEAVAYKAAREKVSKWIQQMRVIFQSADAKNKERVWKKHQVQGDLDDRKLVDAASGSKTIYKRRAEEDSAFFHQNLPKRVILLCDCSGSMYRFNGLDGRLDRMQETALLLMEGLAGVGGHKFDYEIVGHSGEELAIPLVEFGKPPKSDKKRLEVMLKIHAHAQFCMSGDNTLRATKLAIEKVLEQPGDDYFVLVVSDANFRRYGIRPSEFREHLLHPRVNVHGIFLASMFDEAKYLNQSLPPGKTHICLDNSRLPLIIRQILTSSVESKL